jgi:hypothetical protein
VDEKDQAVALNNLALLLKDTNRLAEAEPLMRRAWAIDESSYGPEHPRVGGSIPPLGTKNFKGLQSIDGKPFSMGPHGGHAEEHRGTLLAFHRKKNAMIGGGL